MHIIMITQIQKTDLTKRCVDNPVKDSQIPMLYGEKPIKKGQHWEYEEVAKKHAS